MNAITTGAPPMGTLDRLIHLQTLPDLRDLSAGAKKYLATQTTERVFDAGARLYDAQAPVDAIHFVAAGKVVIASEGARLMSVGAPGRFGFLPILAGEDVFWEATAAEPTRTLELPASSLWRLLQTDATFVETGVRQLSRRMLAVQTELSEQGLLERRAPTTAPFPTEPLTPVERLFCVRVGPWAEAGVEALFDLASGLEEVRFRAGEVLWEADEPADWGLHVVYGVLACGRGASAFQMGPGSIVGELDAYAGLSRRYRAVASSEIVGLRVELDSFLDVAERNHELATHFLSFISRSILKLSARLASGSSTDSGYSSGAEPT